jgi:hypothetical protein
MMGQTTNGAADMSSITFYVGQWLAILTVLVASGRGFYDAYLLPSARGDESGEQRLLHLRDKLKAMGKSPDQQLRLELVKEIGHLYLSTGQYSRAEPFVLEELRAAQNSGDKGRHAEALTATGDFYADWRNHGRAEYCYLQTLPMYTEAQKWDELCRSYLDLTQNAQARADLLAAGSARQAAFREAAKWFGQAVGVSKGHKLSATTAERFRNSYLLMLLAEGSTKELPKGI